MREFFILLLSGNEIPEDYLDANAFIMEEILVTFYALKSYTFYTVVVYSAASGALCDKQSNHMINRLQQEKTSSGSTLMLK